MIRKLIFVLALASGSAVMLGCMAERVDAEPEPSVDVATALARILPEGGYTLRPAPISGFQEVVHGAQVLYLSDDGRYVLQGDLYELETERSLTEERRSELRLALLAALKPEDLIVFAPPAGETKHVLHVFTDVDCTYCRRLHVQMDEYNEFGIEVRYLAFPRSGVDSPLYHKTVSVWCAEDRRAAMTQAKAGDDVPAADCDHPVRAQMELAASFGVSGTPTLVFPDGTSLPGYVPPAQLAAYLDAQFSGR